MFSTPDEKFGDVLFFHQNTIFWKHAKLNAKTHHSILAAQPLWQRTGESAYCPPSKPSMQRCNGGCTQSYIQHSLVISAPTIGNYATEGLVMISLQTPSKLRLLHGSERTSMPKSSPPLSDGLEPIL